MLVYAAIAGIAALLLIWFAASASDRCEGCAYECCGDCAGECCCSFCDCHALSLPLFLLGSLALWGGGLAAIAWTIYSLVRA